MERTKNIFWKYLNLHRVSRSKNKRHKPHLFLLLKKEVLQKGPKFVSCYITHQNLLSSEIFYFFTFQEKMNYCAEIHRQLAGYEITFNRFI